MRRVSWGVERAVLRGPRSGSLIPWASGRVLTMVVEGGAPRALTVQRGWLLSCLGCAWFPRLVWRGNPGYDSPLETPLPEEAQQAHLASQQWGGEGEGADRLQPGFLGGCLRPGTPTAGRQAPPQKRPRALGRAGTLAPGSPPPATGPPEGPDSATAMQDTQHV